MCESWEILTLPWLFGCVLRYGSEEERFPCWCVLMRLDSVGPATACLPVDLERRDYLLQLLSSLLPPLMPPLLKGQATLALSLLHHSRAVLVSRWLPKAQTQSKIQAAGVKEA